MGLYCLHNSWLCGEYNKIVKTWATWSTWTKKIGHKYNIKSRFLIPQDAGRDAQQKQYNATFTAYYQLSIELIGTELVFLVYTMLDSVPFHLVYF